MNLKEVLTKLREIHDLAKKYDINAINVHNLWTGDEDNMTRDSINEQALGLLVFGNDPKVEEFEIELEEILGCKVNVKREHPQRITPSPYALSSVKLLEEPDIAKSAILDLYNRTEKESDSEYTEENICFDDLPSKQNLPSWITKGT